MLLAALCWTALEKGSPYKSQTWQPPWNYLPPSLRLYAIPPYLLPHPLAHPLPLWPL